MISNWQALYITQAFIAALVSASIAYTAWRHRSFTGALPLMFLTLSFFVWSSAYGLELAANDFAFMVTMRKFAYVGIASFPVFWTIFAVQHVGGIYQFRQRDVLLLFIVPVITTFSGWTNELHSLHWGEMRLSTDRDAALLDVTLGPTYWLYLLYTYVLVGVALYWLTQKAFRSGIGFRWQVVILAFSTIVPLAAQLLFILKSSPLPGINLAPLAFSIAGTIFGWGILQYNLLRHVPLARNAIVESMKDGVIILDESKHVVDMNPAAQRMLGLTAAELIRYQPDQIFRHHPEVLSLYHDLMDMGDFANAADEAALGMDARHENTSYIEMRLNRLKNERGSVTGYLLILQDISARKQAELMAARRMAELAALRLVDERISGTLDTDDVLDIALSSALRMCNADAGFISLVEGDQQRIVRTGGNYSNTLIGDQFPLNFGVVGRVVRTRKAALVLDVHVDPDYYNDLPETRAQMAIPLISHDRLIGILNLEAANPESFKQGMFEFAQALAARIAVALENAQLYAVSQNQLGELQKLYDQVSTLEQDKTNIIRLAAHDLRGPAGTIMGYLNLMQLDKDRLDQEHQDWVETMMTLAVRIDTIITDILSLERIQHGQVQEPTNLYELICQAADFYQQEAQKKNVSLNVAGLSSDIMVLCDPAQLREATSNLISNAIKYTPDGGKVDLILKRAGSTAIFEVVDSGYGIPPEMQDRLFQPFFRAKTEETRHIEGTGLGLHLVKSIIERHQGQMRFHSVYGEGSTFGFELPIIE